jgi:hypothetical protein
MESIKYPKIEVNLVGQDGNSFAILGRMQQAFRKAKVPESEIKKFCEEAIQGDYDHLLRTCCEWVNVS